MNGVGDLLASERGVFAIFLMLCATVLVALGKIDADGWMDIAKWLGAALIASKTVTTAVEIHSKRPAPIPPATVINAGSCGCKPPVDVTVATPA